MRRRQPEPVDYLDKRIRLRTHPVIVGQMIPGDSAVAVDQQYRWQHGIAVVTHRGKAHRQAIGGIDAQCLGGGVRSEEHTSELQSLMRISYAVFCLKKKTKKT